MEQENKEKVQVCASTVNSRRTKTPPLLGGMVCLGGDQPPLMLSLLTFKVVGKKLLIDDWSEEHEYLV